MALMRILQIFPPSLGSFKMGEAKFPLLKSNNAIIFFVLICELCLN